MSQKLNKQTKKKERMTKDKVPEDFTLSLALVDAVPVIFFGANMLAIGSLFTSKLFILGALLCLFSGAVKVLWKIIVVLQKKNVWWMFMQMRILMPIGFLMMLISLFVNTDKVSFSGIVTGVSTFPSSIFFLVGAAGMVMMSVFAVKLDNSDLKSNWIEQFTNGISQIAFFIGLLCLIF